MRIEAQSRAARGSTEGDEANEDQNQTFALFVPFCSTGFFSILTCHTVGLTKEELSTINFLI